MLLTTNPDIIAPWGEILTLAAALILGLLRSIYAKLIHVTKEVKQNGGSSIKDAVDRIEYKLSEVLALDEAREQLSPIPMFKCDTSGNVVWVNTKYLSITNKTLDHLQGTGWQDIILDDDREKLIGEWNRAVNEKRRFLSAYRILDETNSRIIKVRSKFFPLMVNHQLKGFFGTLTILEDSLNESSQEFSVSKNN